MARKQSLFLPILLCLAAGCSGSDLGRDVQRTVTAAAVDSLPSLDVRETPALCVADGRNLCPLHAAIANWVDDRRFILWEPGREVVIRSVGDTSAVVLGRSGGDPGQYTQAASVGFTGGEFIILDAWRNRVLHFRGDQSFRDEMAIAPAPPGGAYGFVGPLPLFQVFRASGKDSAVILEVRRVRNFGDTNGTVILTVPVRTMSFRNGVPVTPNSLFPTIPVYTVAENGDVIWTDGDSVTIERRSPAGSVRWHTVIDLPAVTITPEDVALRMQEMKKMAGMTDEDLANVDSAGAKTKGVFPAVTGVTVDHSGRVLIAGPVIPTRDSVSFFVLDRTGALSGRFSLERHSQVLLFTGDSILVHRPTSSEPWEVRWLVVGKRP